MSFRSTRILAIALPAFILSACDSTDPDTRPITLSFTGQASTGANLDITVTAGVNTLVISKAQVVVRRVKLEQTGMSTTCSDDDLATDDCREISVGPVLVDLPLTANAVTSVNAAVP